MPTSGREKYSGTVDDVFDLQERLSRQIVEALQITLSPPEDREIAERPIADIRAFEYYQRARQEYYRYTAEGMAAARALAEHGLAVVGPQRGAVRDAGDGVRLVADGAARRRRGDDAAGGGGLCPPRLRAEPELGAGPVDHGSGRLSPGAARERRSGC